MENRIDLCAVAIRFIKYTDSLHRYAIFEIGRIATAELDELEKAYPQLNQMIGDPTKGALQKKMHSDSDFYTVRICLFIGNICDGIDLIEKESDASNVTITYNSWNMRPSLKSIEHIKRLGIPWFERYPVDWENPQSTNMAKTSDVKEEDVMEIHINNIAIRFVKYADVDQRFAIFEIGRIITGELKDLENAYSHGRIWIDGDPTNGTLQKVEHGNNFLYTVRICLYVGNIHNRKDLIEKACDNSKIAITYTSYDLRPTLKTIEHISRWDDAPWFRRHPVDWDQYKDSSSTDATKTKEEKEMNSEKIEFSESAPKNWVSVYNDLHELFSSWCRKRGATLKESVFSHGGVPDYPQSIYFNILRKYSSNSQDELKFTVHYDDTFKTVAIRFFADNIESFYITTPKERFQIRHIARCEPIFKSFIGDKPSEHQIYGSQTNGDPESKTSANWKPVDVIREYFGKDFLDKIGEIFGKYIPKKTAIFEQGCLMKWSSDPEYQFFDYIRYQFSKLAREWFLSGSVKQIIKSINAVDWEVTVMDSNLLAETYSFRKYRIQLRHLIHVKDSNGIADDDNLAFFKIDPIYGPKRIISDGLDHEFGHGFRSRVELIYNSVRMKIKSFVKEEKKMNNDEKKGFEAIREAVMEGLAETLTAEMWKSKTDEPKFPHFSTDKNGQTLVTIPWDVYKTMANTQYGMAVTVVKDRRTEIKDSYWNPKTGVATIVWADGSKTMSKPMEGTTPDPEIGFAICIAKKFMGGTQNKWRKWLKGVVAASAASAKKKSDKSRIKLEKQARARLREEEISHPDLMQIEAMIETIVKENATRNKPNVSVKFIDHSYDAPVKSAPKKRPSRKKKTN